MKIKFWGKKPNGDISETNIYSGISENDFQLMLKFGKPNNKIGGYESKQFIELPYGMVKIEIPAILKEEDNIGAVDFIMKQQFEDFNINNYSGNEVILFLLWIKTQLEHINKIEIMFLHSEPEPEMVAAGINKLNEFDVEPLIERIAKDWNIKPEDVLKYPYHKIYRKLKMDKIQMEINKSYQKIIEDKHRHK